MRNFFPIFVQITFLCTFRNKAARRHFYSDQRLLSDKFAVQKKRYKQKTLHATRKVNDIDTITKQDVATQTNEIETRDNSDKEMNQELIDLKSRLEKAN